MHVVFGDDPQVRCEILEEIAQFPVGTLAEILESISTTRPFYMPSGDKSERSIKVDNETSRLDKQRQKHSKAERGRRTTHKLWVVEHYTHVSDYALDRAISPFQTFHALTKAPTKEVILEAAAIDKKINQMSVHRMRHHHGDLLAQASLRDEQMLEAEFNELEIRSRRAPDRTSSRDSGSPSSLCEDGEREMARVPATAKHLPAQHSTTSLGGNSQGWSPTSSSFTRTVASSATSPCRSLQSSFTSVSKRKRDDDELDEYTPHAIRRLA